MGMVVYLRRLTAEQLKGIQENPEDLERFVFSGEDGTEVIDFDKAWHALHFMMTGNAGMTSHPLSVLVADDRNMIGTDELGLGGYWLLDPQRVDQFARTLEQLSDDDLIKTFDPTRMVADNVYLSEFFVEEAEEALPYIMQGVPRFRAFAEAASRDGDHVIGILS
ncbi:YfbM family protein [Sphingomonas sp. HF-S3]|jgi:hypothetical protein|uniref:YfbM family protein n=1 Tax=Sphingomonas rustica TaxID=3103142 RepID=A0ABV0B6C5_9SPHN